MKLFLIVSVLLVSSVGLAEEHKPGISPSTSLNWLVNGNKRFYKSNVRKDGQSPSDIERLSTGQTPHAIILSCSDSRVPPEVVFDQKLGEIFVVRTAGEALDNNVIGSIEYAVEHLGSNLIVVMGHTSCGAVKAALGSLDGSSAGTPALDGLVQDIHPRIQAYKGAKPSPNVEKESWSNTEGVARDLIVRSKLLKEHLEAGKLMVVPSLYSLETGRVIFHEKVKVSLPVKVRKSASEH